MGKNVEHLNESVKIVLQFSPKTYFNVAIFHLFKIFQSNTNRYMYQQCQDVVFPTKCL